MDRDTALRRVGFLVFGVNALLALATGGIYLLTGSVAVESIAVNSLSDVVYSIVVIAGLYLTTQPPDISHPHGHERIEPFVALFVALGIFAAGVAVLWNAVRSILTGSIAVAGLRAMGVLIGAAVVKFLLYRYCLRMSETYNSPVIEATALDNRIDVFASGAALVGVIGASLGIRLLDPIAGAVVSIGILYTGVDIVRDNFGYLVGMAPPSDLREEILERALSHPEVEGVHDVVPHYVGPEVDVSLHLEIEGDRTLIEAHTIETEIVESIRDIPKVDDVFVHLDPEELGEWKEEEEGRVGVEETNDEE
jgi:cation diffusion facilitator family transporter